jgi:hypothetical protein
MLTRGESLALFSSKETLNSNQAIKGIKPVGVNLCKEAENNCIGVGVLINLYQ